MKNLLLIFVFLLSSLVCIADENPYSHYYDIVNTEISSMSDTILNLKSQLKEYPNNVELHKELVRKQTALKLLQDKKKKVDATVKLYNALVKENEKLDKQKTNTLHAKEKLAAADEDLIKLFK